MRTRRTKGFEGMVGVLREEIGERSLTRREREGRLIGMGRAEVVCFVILLEEEEEEGRDDERCEVFEDETPVLL